MKNVPGMLETYPKLYIFLLSPYHRLCTLPYILTFAYKQRQLCSNPMNYWVLECNTLIQVFFLTKLFFCYYNSFFPIEISIGNGAIGQVTESVYV